MPWDAQRATLDAADQDLDFNFSTFATYNRNLRLLQSSK